MCFHNYRFGLGPRDFYANFRSFRKGSAWEVFFILACESAYLNFLQNWPYVWFISVIKLSFARNYGYDFLQTWLARIFNFLAEHSFRSSVLWALQEKPVKQKKVKLITKVIFLCNPNRFFFRNHRFDFSHRALIGSFRDCSGGFISRTTECYPCKWFQKKTECSHNST